MPSIRMGALIGTSVCAASDSEDIMGVDVDVGRPASCGDSLMHHLQSWSGPSSDTDDQPETKHDEAQATCYPSPQSRSQGMYVPELSHTHAERLHLSFSHIGRCSFSSYAT
jgi:hypothetical protein